MTSQFYITLPSNTEQGSTASNFRVTLPQRLRLDGQWEVGLAEIIYPNSWYNVYTDKLDTMFRISYLSEGSDQLNFFVGFIPQGRYSNITELCETLNKVCNTFHTKIGAEIPDTNFIDFAYNSVRNKVELSVKTRYIKEITLSDRIVYMLGFKDPNFYNLMEIDAPADVMKIMAANSIDMNGGLETLYVYCNVVKDQIVGNALAPLLRIVDVRGEYKSIINRNYANPHYVPILQKDITSIEINIKNDMNEFVSFEFGKVVVKLHFRRCSVVPFFD